MLLGVVAALAAAVGAAGLVVGFDLLRDRPGSAGADLWVKDAAPAPPILDGSASRVTSGSNKPNDLSFELRWPASDQTTYFFVSCDEGKIAVEMSGGATGIQCNGAKQVLTAVGSHAESEWVRVTVDRPQQREWGAALYR